jgi:hypothetical protein
MFQLSTTRTELETVDEAPAIVDHVLGRDQHFLPVPCRRAGPTLRIAVVGDSYAYGFGVNELQALPAQLEDILNGMRADGRTFEVLNLACPGYNVMAAHTFLVQHVLPWIDLDLLIWCVSSDDASPVSRQELSQETTDWRAAWQAQWDDDGRGARWLRHAFGSARKAVEKVGARLVVVYLEPVRPNARARRLLSAVTTDAGIQYRDLSDVFAGFDDSRLAVSPADVHPSALAHRLAATELAIWLGSVMPDRDAAAERSRLSAGMAAQYAVWLDRRHASSAQADTSSPARAIHASAILSAVDVADLADELLRLERYIQLDAEPGADRARQAVGAVELLASAVRTTSDSIARMASSVSVDEWPHLVEAVDRIRTLLGAVSRVADRCARQPVGRRSLDSLTHVMGACAAIAQRVDAVDALTLRDHPPSFLVAVDAGTLPPARRVVVECVFSIVHPVRRQLRQSHYAIQDGAVHSYRFFPPLGCVAVPRLRIVAAPPDDSDWIEVPATAMVHAEVGAARRPVAELWSLCAAGASPA